MASNVLQSYLLLIGMVDIAISLTGLFWRKQRREEPSRQHRFALIIPAHNEENVVGCCLDSLNKLDYPKDKFDIFLVADHCTDATVRIAREHGAAVYEHVGSVRGKGFALKWVTAKILALERHDALCYFDADALAHPNFLNKINARLRPGVSALQGRQISKNPNDGWIARMLSVGLMISARFWHLPKEHLGLSAALHGKGMCFRPEVMREHQWDGACLTEDLDMEMRLVRAGIRIRWVEDAVVYNEEPATVAAHMKRLLRWTRGGMQVARKHTAPLFLRAFRRLDPSALQAAIWCSLVFRPTWWMVAAMYLTHDSFHVSFWIFHHLPAVRPRVKFLVIMPLLQFPVLALYWERAPWKSYLAYLLQPALGLFRIPVSIWSMFSPADDWYRTEHNSRVTIADLVPLKPAASEAD